MECVSPLAIEFSDGPHRIFNNCGMPASASAAWRRAAADIAAHNTVEVTSFEGGSQNSPVAEVISSPQGSLIRATNDIAGNTGRVSHHRSIFLSQTGTDLRGEDQISPGETNGSYPGPFDFTIRFHLHPGVKGKLQPQGNADCHYARQPNRLAVHGPWRRLVPGGKRVSRRCVWTPQNPANRHSGLDRICSSGKLGPAPRGEIGDGCKRPRGNAAASFLVA